MNNIGCSPSQNILKFLQQSPQNIPPIQKKCFPQQKFGVSKESPFQFQNLTSLINPKGYYYPHQQKYATGTNQFRNYTQQKIFEYNKLTPQINYVDQYTKDYEINPQIFHRKKGLLSQYMQKNSRLGKVHKLMGYQRTKYSRELCNKSIKQKIKKLKKSPNSKQYQVSNRTKTSRDDSFYIGICEKMNQKMRIRNSRILLFQQKLSQRLNRQQKLSQPFSVESFSKKQLRNELQINSKSNLKIKNIEQSIPLQHLLKINGMLKNSKSKRLIKTQISQHQINDKKLVQNVNDYSD